MEKQKLTVTRGLSTLKLLDKRIRKASQQLFINTTLDEKPTKETLVENYQSVMDLIKYRNDLKAAIMVSNAKTIVKINNEEMTVAEAIERKSSIQYMYLVVQSMKEQFVRAHNEVDSHNNSQEKRLDALLEANFSKDGKYNSDEFKSIVNEFWKKNKAELVDPLDIQKKFQEIEAEIDMFESEVDLVLSESNATTFLDI